MRKKIIGLYPGSFDPVTNGHLDISFRASKLCDILYVAVVTNPKKQSFFSLEDRIEFLKRNFQGKSHIRVSSFNGLLVNYAKKIKASIIFRGLRAVSDFEYEFQMALINRTLFQKIETVFLVPSEKYVFLSSSAVKEVAQLGGNIKNFVPPKIVQYIKKKTKNTVSVTKPLHF
jgi:pantetheine-phosphate adenylyltransferase